MREPARQQKQFAFFDDDFVRLATVERPNPHGDVSLELEEEFLRRVDVKIVARVRTAGHEDDHVRGSVEQLLVAYRGLEIGCVFLDPLGEVEFGGQVHGGDLRGGKR